MAFITTLNKMSLFLVQIRCIVKAICLLRFQLLLLDSSVKHGLKCQYEEYWCIVYCDHVTLCYTLCTYFSWCFFFSYIYRRLNYSPPTILYEFVLSTWSPVCMVLVIYQTESSVYVLRQFGNLRRLFDLRLESLIKLVECCNMNRPIGKMFSCD